MRLDAEAFETLITADLDTKSGSSFKRGLRGSQSDMGCSRSTFKRATREFWEIWPIAPWTGEVCDVVFLDGIWIGRDDAAAASAPSTLSSLLASE